MNNWMKRILSLVMALILCVNLVPFGALAQAADPAEETFASAMGETVPETTAASVPETSGETVPETSEETVPETSEEAVPETSEEAVPETSEEAVPETSEEAVPETSEEAVPETSEETVPETSEGAVPEGDPEIDEALQQYALLLEQVPEGVRKHTVLVLDTSDGLDQEAQASLNAGFKLWSEKLLEASHFISLITMDGQLVCGPTQDGKLLRRMAEELPLGGCDYAAGLKKASALVNGLQAIGPVESSTYELVLCANGSPMVPADPDAAEQPDAAALALEAAAVLKEQGVKIYAAGLLSGLTQEQQAAAAELLTALADSSEHCFTAQAPNTVLEKIAMLQVLGHVNADGLWEDPNIAYSNADVQNALNEFSMRPTLFAANQVERYNVVILDTSGSMYGQPIEVQKKAAERFCQDVMKAPGQNYVAIVELKHSASVICNFTADLDRMMQAIQQTYDSGGTNIGEALQKADELLSNTPTTGAKVVKNVVLCSDGLPEHGIPTENGRYTNNDSYCYATANTAFNQAEAMKNKGITIYSLGFFHSMSGSYLTFGTRFMKDLASDGKDYIVQKAEDLEFIFGDIAANISIKEFDFQFHGSLAKNQNVTSLCYYTDGYFYGDATTYNSHLSTMSLCFEVSAWTDPNGWDHINTQDLSDERNPWHNAYELLLKADNVNEDDKVDKQETLTQAQKDSLFRDFEVNEFWLKEPTRDSIGCIAAHKNLQKDGTPLIAVAVRGGGYGSEWASNFTVGGSGDHDGFAEARDNVLQFLRDYVQKYRITGDVKVWIVGYSRAGAVANMVAGKLNDIQTLGNGTAIYPSNLFAYTFEAPQGAVRSNVSGGSYSNIHNVVNSYDIVPLVAPGSWGFSRYNDDHWLPCPATCEEDEFDDLKARMLKYYNKFGIHATEPEDGTYHLTETVVQNKLVCHPENWLPFGDPLWEIVEVEVPTERAVHEFGDFVFNHVFHNRNTYYLNYQGMMREIMAVLMGKGPSTLKLFMRAISKRFDIPGLLNMAKPLWALNLDSPTVRLNKVQANVSREIAEALVDAEVPRTAAGFSNLVHKIQLIFWGTLEGAITDLLNKNTRSVQSIGNVLSFGKYAFQPHYPELALAWLMSQDDHYEVGNTVNFYHHFRIIHINCPVDVQVYRDGTGVQVASIVNDVPQNIPNSSIVAYVNMDGEKVVMLPSGGSYTVIMTGTGAGNVSYSVQEWDLKQDAPTRVVRYNQVKVAPGEVLTAGVPAMSEADFNRSIPNGSSVSYSLTDQNNVPQQPAADKRGSAAIEATYTVTVSANNQFGFISGGGKYAEGTFASVEATPFSGGKFEGWFQNGQLVSTEAQYRFPVTADTSLEARFAEVTLYKLTVKYEGDGISQTQNMQISAGSKVKLKAVPDSDASLNAKFIGWKATDGEIQDASKEDTWFTMPASDVVITACFTSKYPPVVVVPDVKDDTDTLLPGKIVEIDGNRVEVEPDGTIWAPSSKCRLMVTYEYANADKTAHEAYPTHMHVWLLNAVDENNDGIPDKATATRISELEDIMLYQGTSIRVNDKSNGIRFFTAMPSADRHALLSGSLLGGKLKGCKLKEMGTLYKWARTGTELTVENGAVSYVYGGSIGNRFRLFKKVDANDWITGMLTQLPGDPETLSADIVSRPYMRLECNGEEFVLYGGEVIRSIYYVALQNRDEFKEGSSADKFVEDIISNVEQAQP